MRKPRWAAKWSARRAGRAAGLAGEGYCMNPFGDEELASCWLNEWHRGHVAWLTK